MCKGVTVVEMPLVPRGHEGLTGQLRRSIPDSAESLTLRGTRDTSIQHLTGVSSALLANVLYAWHSSGLGSPLKCGLHL